MTDEEVARLYAAEREMAILTSRQADRQKLIDERFAKAEMALSVALESANKRLDGMNEFRQALQDQSNKQVSRLELEAGISTLNAKIDGGMRALGDKLEVATAPNYVLGFSAISVILVMVAGFWSVVGLRIESAINPMAVTVEQVRLSNLNQDQNITRIMETQGPLTAERRKETSDLRIDVTRLKDWVDNHAAAK